MNADGNRRAKLCNQTGRVYFCITSTEPSVCRARLYNTLHPDDGIIALLEQKTTLYLGSISPVNGRYVIRRYFSQGLVFHSRYTAGPEAWDVGRLLIISIRLVPEDRKEDCDGLLDISPDIQGFLLLYPVLPDVCPDVSGMAIDLRSSDSERENPSVSYKSDCTRRCC